MSSIAFDEAEIAWKAVAEFARESSRCWATGTRMDQLDRLETLERSLPAMRHQLINELVESATVEELGGSLARAMGDPEAQRRGVVGREHVQIIRGFFRQLPCFVDEPTRAAAERDLAEVAGRYRPDELRRYAEHYDLVLNPDGRYSEKDRARRRGVAIGPQGPDGMSRLTGWLEPELRAGLDAAFAKWAAPGMCDPADKDSTVDGVPGEESVTGDVRSAAQRNHDALNAIARATLMSPEMGSHNGIPVTITVTATLEDLHAKAGMARTGGGTLLP